MCTALLFMLCQSVIHNHSFISACNVNTQLYSHITHSRLEEILAVDVEVLGQYFSVDFAPLCVSLLVCDFEYFMLLCISYL